MAQSIVTGELPEPFDPRVTRLLAEPLGEDVVVSVSFVNRGKNPAVNSRWELRRGGDLYVVRHSGQNVTFEVPFDQPFPAAPAARLGAARVAEILARLDEAGFAGQPAYQADPGVDDGEYVIVRVREGQAVHQVVYENAPSPVVKYLRAVAE